MLPRLIRYIEERRADERRFTGAIETDPSPLHIVWGLDDPIAVPSMVDTLLAARPDVTAVRLDRVGHYPMVEAPQRFLGAALAGLGPIPRASGVACNLTAVPRRRPPSNRYELLTCAWSGHVLVGTEAATVTPDDALVPREEGAVRWHRRPRCDDWVPRSRARTSGP